jgi:cytosine/adenosine deaminase-related metal-dependent hydrolase
METVHDTDAVFEALRPLGLRAVVGKYMMDADGAMPARLMEQTAHSIDESVAIAKRWHGRVNGRLRAAFAPRFAVSCSHDCSKRTVAIELSSSSTRARESRRDRVDQVADRTQEHRLSPTPG